MTYTNAPLMKSQMIAIITLANPAVRPAKDNAMLMDAVRRLSDGGLDTAWSTAKVIRDEVRAGRRWRVSHWGDVSAERAQAAMDAIAHEQDRRVSM